FDEVLQTKGTKASVHLKNESIRTSPRLLAFVWLAIHSFCLLANQRRRDLFSPVGGHKLELFSPIFYDYLWNTCEEIGLLLI
ncbi:hypothetical protein, partial [Pseudoalteromonas sp.]|uniref:hypothetical protein n=1 Tax=Pseudoalteromonas sp. TaxID=53249 RepID=UPI002622ABC7